MTAFDCINNNTLLMPPLGTPPLLLRARWRRVALLLQPWWRRVAPLLQPQWRSLAPLLQPRWRSISKRTDHQGKFYIQTLKLILSQKYCSVEVITPPLPQQSQQIDKPAAKCLHLVPNSPEVPPHSTEPSDNADELPDIPDEYVLIYSSKYHWSKLFSF